MTLLPPEVVAAARETLDRLRDDHYKVAVAESCTGGLLGATLTAVPGSSDAFLGGVVAYDNKVKMQLLGISETLIGEHGAVSAAAVEAMAHGVRERFGADVAVAISGIAGPSGGGPHRPVGTVWMAVLGPGESLAVHRIQADGERDQVRLQAVQEALAFLQQAVKEAHANLA